MGEKIMTSKKSRHYLVVLNYDLIRINFFISETLYNNFNEEKVTLSFQIFLFEFFSFLDYTYRLNKIFYPNFKKFLIDIINII